MLRTYTRLIFLLRPSVVVVFDDLVSPDGVSVSWLLHTLSSPEVEADRLKIHRGTAALEVRLFTTLDDLSFSFTDRHGIDPNEGEPTELHRHQSPQYHLTWETGVSSRRRFLGVMTVNGAEALIKKTDTCVRVTYEDQSLEVQLDPGTTSFGRLNGQPC